MGSRQIYRFSLFALASNPLAHVQTSQGALGELSNALLALAEALVALGRYAGTEPVTDEASQLAGILNGYRSSRLAHPLLLRAEARQVQRHAGAAEAMSPETTAPTAGA